MTGYLPSQTSLEGYRQQFPALANKAYFNYGGQGPLPRVALEAIQKAFETVQESGPFSLKGGRWIVEQGALTRQAIAGELGVSASSITLTEDVTVGCNIALWSIDWQRGDRLLLADSEHPGVMAAVQQLQRRWHIEVDTCPLTGILKAEDATEAIAQSLRPRTRLVVLSHILWNTGHILPLAEIVQLCRSHSARVLVDAAQSVGVMPLNLTELGVDFYAFTGHKWLCGPEGVGALYVNPDILESLQPTFVGWRSIAPYKLGEPFQWQPDARRFEIATSAYPLYVGLQAAIALHHQWGTAEERFAQIRQKSQYLWQQLAELPNVTRLLTSPPEAGLVSFKISDRSQQEVVKLLEDRDIIVRRIYYPECVRACIHYLTLESEIDRLVEAIHKLRFL